MFKIDFLIGDTPYNSTVHFSKAFARALEAHGVECRLFSVAEGQFHHALHALLTDPPDFTCSFSDIVLGGRSLGELTAIPHLSLLLDPAIYFLHQVSGWVSCVDEGDAEFLQAGGAPRVLFLPHAGDSHLKRAPGSGERLYDTVFFGTCLDIDQIKSEWKDRFDTSTIDLLLAASSCVLSKRSPSILDALLELGVEEEKLPIFHLEVDRYTRGKDRIELLSRCKKVHVWGEGAWARYLPNATVHPPISFEKTLEIMSRAKVVVSSSPRFKRGWHERIFYGALAGAAVLSNTDIGFHYEYGEWELPDMSAWREVAEKAQAVTLTHHTWDHRARTLLDFIL